MLTSLAIAALILGKTLNRTTSHCEEMPAIKQAKDNVTTSSKGRSLRVANQKELCGSLVQLDHSYFFLVCVSHCRSLESKVLRKHFQIPVFHEMFRSFRVAG